MTRIACQIFPLLMAICITKQSSSFQNSMLNIKSHPLIQRGISNFIDTISTNLRDVNLSSSRIYEPRNSKRKLEGSAALVIVPGCFVKPDQYDALVQSIQKQSDQDLWVIVPEVPLGAANPLTIRQVIKDSMAELRQHGYSGESIFLGGHSLGAAFLPDIIEDFAGNVAGLVMLGSFVRREKEGVIESSQVPTLTLCGELDGLVRSSRIAESYHHLITTKGDTDEAKLNNPVVLIEGMNHFQYLTGEPHLMKKFRDLTPDIDDRRAVNAVGSTVAHFLDYHSQSLQTQATEAQTNDDSKSRSSLLDKVSKTGKYLQPLIQAMQLEGNQRFGTNHASCNGSPWTQHMQEVMLQQPSSDDSVATTMNQVNIDSVHDEFHDSWYLNPLSKVPFFHPKIDVKKSEQGETKLALTTCTEAVYEQFEGMFDTGFFSNTCVELRAKMTSLQAAQMAMGIENVPFEESADIARKLNEQTIQWAINNVPESVRRRYLQRGIPLVAGKDIGHKTGPGWIWSSLSFRRDTINNPITGEAQDCTVVNSHTMSTAMDHPIPFAGGKMYCKLLSPARAMDYIYTDSLRPSPFKDTLQQLVFNMRSPFQFQKSPKKVTIEV